MHCNALTEFAMQVANYFLHGTTKTMIQIFSLEYERTVENSVMYYFMHTQKSCFIFSIYVFELYNPILKLVQTNGWRRINK